MLTSEQIKKIKKIHIRSHRLVNAMMAGRYKSVFRGSGMEFEEVRDYSPGDEIRDIDWKVSARLGRPFVKKYREEREQVVMLLVDMSASKMFGTTENLKVETAAEIAGILAFNAIRNNDKVGVIFFTDRVEKYIPPKKGSAHVWRVIKEIFTFAPEGRGTDIRAALDFMSRISKKRSFAFVISDFLSPDYERNLKILCRRHEVVGLRVYDTGAFHLPESGIVSVMDFETRKTRLLDAGNRRTRDWYFNARTQAHTEAEHIFSRAKTDLVDIKTSDSVSDALTRYFRLRERRAG